MSEQSPISQESIYKVFGLHDQVTVIRSDGMVEHDWKVGRIIYEENSNQIKYYAVIKPTNDGMYIEKKVLPSQLDSWNGQPTDLPAPERVESVVSGSISSPLGVLATKDSISQEEFDPQEANLRRSIADALEAKREAQRKGDGDASMYWGQVAGQNTRELQEYLANR